MLVVPAHHEVSEPNAYKELSNTAHNEDTGSLKPSDFLVETQWEAYGDLFTIILSFISIAIFLLVLKESPLRNLTQMVPETLVLIASGLSVGAAVFFSGESSRFRDVDVSHYINYMLPPIILDSAYHIYSRQLMYQLDGILAFAFCNTAFNVIAVGLSLYAIASANFAGIHEDLSLMECLLLSSIVAAVDPVAVLTVFGQLGVSPALYFLIFGESLLNDGVTIVFFDGIERLIEANSTSANVYVFAVLSFFTVTLGGLAVGFLMGIFSSIACRYTTRRSKVLEPAIILMFAYFSFVASQMLRWSGFVALTSCGLAQKRYAFPNLFEKSRVTIVEGMETTATVAEALLFLLLGVDCYVGFGWNLPLIVWTILFISVYRFLGIGLISLTLNRCRTHELTFHHIFVMAYSGLRGAVSYALAASAPREDKLFVTTTLAVIFFTTFVQGGTVKFIVKCFDFVENKDTSTSRAFRLATFRALTSMEAILGGVTSCRIHYWAEKLEHWDTKYLRNYLVLQKKRHS